MKKSLFLFVAAMFCLYSNSQIYLPVNPTQYGVNINRAKALIASHITVLSDTNSLHSTDTTAQWGLYNGKLYWHYGYWRPMGTLVTSSRFGYTGEDELADGARQFNGNGYSFGISNTNSFVIQGQSIELYSSYSGILGRLIISGGVAELDGGDYKVSATSAYSYMSGPNGYISVNGNNLYRSVYVGGGEALTYFPNRNLSNGSVDTLATMGYVSGTLSGYVSSSGSYSNPSWLSALAWSKIVNTPTTISGYGITDAASLSANTFTGTQTAPSFTMTGTGGSGALKVKYQSSNPTTASSEAAIYVDNSGRLTWRKQSNGAVVAINGVGTINFPNAYTFPSAVGSSTSTVITDYSDNNYYQFNTFNGYGANMSALGGTKIAGAVSITDGSNRVDYGILNSSPLFIRRSSGSNSSSLNMILPTPDQPYTYPTAQYIWRFPSDEYDATFASRAWVNSQGFLTSAGATPGIADVMNVGQAISTFSLGDNDGNIYMSLSSPTNDNYAKLKTYTNGYGGMSTRLYLDDGRAFLGWSPDENSGQEDAYVFVNNRQSDETNQTISLHAPIGVYNHTNYFSVGYNDNSPEVSPERGFIAYDGTNRIAWLGDNSERYNGNNFFIDDANSIAYLRNTGSTIKVGINKTDPTKNLDINGSSNLGGAVYYKSALTGDADYTVGVNDYLIDRSEYSAVHTIILPIASDNIGRKLLIYSGTTYGVKFSEDIKEFNGNTFTAGTTAYGTIEIMSVNSSWVVISTSSTLIPD